METKLKKYHKETGVKQGFVADKAKITPGAYSLIVRGESVPSLPAAIRIARVLNMTVEELWGYLVEEES
ncbi:MAG: helix-turn-helix transcriptional regulator [Bacillota bacterium]